MNFYKKKIFFNRSSNCSNFVLLAVVLVSLFIFFTTKGLSIEESIDKANYEMTIDPNNDLNKVHPSKVIFLIFINIIKNQFLEAYS